MLMLLPRTCLFRFGDKGTIIHPHAIAGWLEVVFVEGDPVMWKEEDAVCLLLLLGTLR